MSRAMIVEFVAPSVCDAVCTSDRLRQPCLNALPWPLIATGPVIVAGAVSVGRSPLMTLTIGTANVNAYVAPTVGQAFASSIAARNVHFAGIWVSAQMQSPLFASPLSFVPSVIANGVSAAADPA